MNDLMTVPKAARSLGLCKKTLYNRLKAHKMYAVRLGGILFVPASEIERMRKDGDAGKTRV